MDGDGLVARKGGTPPDLSSLGVEADAAGRFSEKAWCGEGFGCLCEVDALSSLCQGLNTPQHGSKLHVSGEGSTAEAEDAQREEIEAGCMCVFLPPPSLYVWCRTVAGFGEHLCRGPAGSER